MLISQVVHGDPEEPPPERRITSPTIQPLKGAEKDLLQQIIEIGVIRAARPEVPPECRRVPPHQLQSGPFVTATPKGDIFLVGRMHGGQFIHGGRTPEAREC